MITLFTKNYLEFIEHPGSTFWAKVLFCGLRGCSYLYGAGINLINLLYDKKILKTYTCQKPVISVGNISWGGTGKSTLILKIYAFLKDNVKTAILRRGYGGDEEAMLKRVTPDVYSHKDRAFQAFKLQDQFNCFLLDDGFQYRRLNRKLNIVVMTARELKHTFYLIPAYIFRERMESLRRADCIVVNYKSQIADTNLAAQALQKYSRAPIFFTDYVITGIVDRAGRNFLPEEINAVKSAAITAIGYPQGFFLKLKECGVSVDQEIIFPDHHEFSAHEVEAISISLVKKSITHIIITAKDKNRFRVFAQKFKVLIVQIDMKIDDAFFGLIKSALNINEDFI